jgi:hypothetical protein
MRRRGVATPHAARRTALTDTVFASTVLRLVTPKCPYPPRLVLDSPVPLVQLADNDALESHRSRANSTLNLFAFLTQGGITGALKILLEYDTLNKFTIAENGRQVPWLRYVGWLITCPGRAVQVHIINTRVESACGFSA